MSTEHTDIFAQPEAEYAATESPALVDIDWGWFLTIDGQGHPDDSEFKNCLAALYTVAEALRQDSAQAGRVYELAVLEAMWHLDPGYADFDTAPRSAWNWTLCLRTPDLIGENDLDRIVEKLLAEGHPRIVSRVALAGFEEGRCVQMLHTGPYDQEASTLAVMHAFMERQGLTVVGRHHEIYLSDPASTPPAALKTIIRLPVM
ncbi:MAG: GyrI-like domain-containing protein [Acidobacteriota bacterium]